MSFAVGRPWRRLGPPKRRHSRSPAASGASPEMACTVKSLRSPRREMTYGLVFLLGLSFISAGLAIFPTYSKSLGLGLVVCGVVVFVTGALLVDSCVARMRASKQCKPPAYEAVVSHDVPEDTTLACPEALFPVSEPRPVRRHRSLPSPWCVCAPQRGFAGELGGVNELGRKHGAQRPWCNGPVVYTLQLPAAGLHGPAGRLFWPVEPWPERDAIWDLVQPPYVSFDAAAVHPARARCEGPAGKSPPKGLCGEPPSYDAVLAGDRPGASLASTPGRQTGRNDGGRMTRGRSSAPELFSSPLSIGASSLGCSER